MERQTKSACSSYQGEKDGDEDEDSPVMKEIINMPNGGKDGDEEGENKLFAVVTAFSEIIK